MKEELEKLGFELRSNEYWYVRDYHANIVVNNSSKTVWVVEHSENEDSIFMFKYNHEKLKQLIKILS